VVARSGSELRVSNGLHIPSFSGGKIATN